MSDKEKLSVAVGSRSFSYQGVRANRVKDVVDFIVKQGDLVKGAASTITTRILVQLFAAFFWPFL